MSVFVNTFGISSVSEKTGARYRGTRSRINRGAPTEFRIHRDGALGNAFCHHASGRAANSSRGWPANQSCLSSVAPARIESEQRRKRNYELFSSVLLIECEVQLQNIDAGLTKDAKIASIGILLDELADFVFAQASRLSDTRDLELGIVQANLWIKSATRRGNCIRRHRLASIQAIFRAICSYSFF